MSAPQKENTRAIQHIVLLAFAAVASMALGVARTKLLAIFFGRSGLGLLGLLQSAVATGTLIVGLGIDGVGARELARAQSETPERVPLIRAGLSKGVLFISSVGAILAAPILVVVVYRLGYHEEALWAPLLSIGVVAGVMSANGRAALAGHALVGGIARSSIFGAAFALFLVSVTFWMPMGPALTFAALSLPLAQWALTASVLRGLPRIPAVSVRVAVRESLALARMASVFAVAGIVPVLSQFLVRMLVGAKLGAEQLGLFQASLALTTTAVGVLAASMGPSLLPRLAAQAENHAQFNDTLVSQVTSYLAIFAPILLTLEVVPDLVVRILYSADFTPAADQLSWQMVGEVVRLPNWAMATALTAQRRGGSYLIVESVSLMVTIVLVSIAASLGSLPLMGCALSVASIIQFFVLSRMMTATGFRWPTRVRVEIVVLMAVSIGLSFAVPHFLAARVMGAVVAIAAGIRAARMILRSRQAGA